MRTPLANTQYICIRYVISDFRTPYSFVNAAPRTGSSGELGTNALLAPLNAAGPGQKLARQGS